MADRTPGPWSINREHEYCGVRIDGPNGRSIGHAIQRDEHPTLGCGISQQQAQANALLMTAAPDLLEVAEMVLATATLETSPDLIAAAVAALAKVKGRMP